MLQLHSLILSLSIQISFQELVEIYDHLLLITKMRL